MDDDEYGTIPDDALAAALDAAEKATASRPPAQPRPAPVLPIATAARPPAQTTAKPVQSTAAKPAQPAAAAKPVQPTPQKLSRPAGSSNEIIVSPRQKGNPILSHIKSVPWSYGPSTLAADYLLSPTTCALFLSLKYHKLHPDYLTTRLRLLGDAFTLRVLLVLVDITEHALPLKQLTKLSVGANLTLLLCWSSPEAGRYLEALKSLQHAPPTGIMEKLSEDYGERLGEVFTRVRGVNRTDAVAAVSMFGSVRAVVNASEEERLLVAGWGPQKGGRFERAVREGFRVGKRKKNEAPKEVGRKQVKGPDVAARLGLGVQRREMLDQWTIEDDEEALAAVAAMEEEDRRKGAAAASYIGKEKGKEKEMPLDVQAAVAAMEEEERRRGAATVSDKGKEKGKGREVPLDVQAGIAAALARMRERT
jgi:DNA excision repair protein ERCC-1